MTHDETPTCLCKVGRNVEQYDLDDLNTELRDRRVEAGRASATSQTTLTSAFWPLPSLPPT